MHDALNVKIRLLEHTDLPAWGTLLSEAPDTHFFHRPEWPALLQDALGFRSRTLIAEDQGRILGVLPLSEVRSRLFGSGVCSLPFCAYGGPLLGGPDGQSIAEGLLTQACRAASASGLSRVEVRGYSTWRTDAPVQDLYSTFIGPIPDGLDDLSGIPQKRRNVVRRAQAMGLSAVVHRDVDRFFDLYAENCRTHGTPGLGKSFFRKLLLAFDASSLDVLTVVDGQGRDVSTIMNFYHRQTVMAYFAGENALARQCNGNDYKYWALMRHAQQRGLSRFDFGRSKRATGSFKFKQLWGFQPTPLRYEFPYLRSGEVPQNNPSNPKFEIAMNVWQRLPRMVTDRMGPWIVRGLG